MIPFGLKWGLYVHIPWVILSFHQYEVPSIQLLARARLNLSGRLTLMADQDLPDEQPEIEPPKGDPGPSRTTDRVRKGGTLSEETRAKMRAAERLPNRPPVPGTVSGKGWIVPPKDPSVIKFTDELKETYLEKLADHGKKMLACKQIGLSYQTFLAHQKNDTVFAERVVETLLERSERIGKQLEEEALEGHPSFTYDPKTGELIKEERKYETPMRMAMLKRHDPEYKEQQDVNVNIRGGVLVVPGRVTQEEWDKLFAPKVDPSQEDDDESGS